MESCFWDQGNEGPGVKKLFENGRFFERQASLLYLYLRRATISLFV